MSDHVDREHESDYANFVLNPDPETIIEQVDLGRKRLKEDGWSSVSSALEHWPHHPPCDCRAVDLPANHQGVCPVCQRAK